MELLLGFVIALAISLTGVGAGSMTTPLLILLLGASPASAVGTALAFGAVVKLASVPLYAIRRQVNLRVLRLLLAGGLPGFIAGAFLLDRLKRGPYNGVLYVGARQPYRRDRCFSSVSRVSPSDRSPRITTAPACCLGSRFRSEPKWDSPPPVRVRSVPYYCSP